MKLIAGLVPSAGGPHPGPQGGGGAAARTRRASRAPRSSTWRSRARAKDTVLLYGHLDKQPEMTGWRAGPRALGAGARGRQALRPRRRGRRLLGLRLARGHPPRCKEQKLPHARCVVLIEACEESGSTDLPAYIERLAPRIGQPSLVVCLDSGCGNYEQLWMTTSLRGLVVRQPARGDPHRGRALGRRQRHRALLVPHPPPAAGSRGGRADRAGALEGLHVQVPPARAGAGRGGGRRCWARRSIERSPGCRARGR